jgi:Nuclease-related domain
VDLKISYPSISSENMTWESKPLRYGGTCDFCGATIEKREVGWHNATLKKVRCATCGPTSDETSAQELESTPATIDPVGGSAALREARARRDPKWTKGAAGEYLMDLSLHKHINEGAVILTDREVPGTKSNIDHIVVAPSGVWIIDAKIWRGKIEYKSTSMFSAERRLFVGGKDRSSAVEAIFNLVIPVAQVIGDKSVPIKPALVFIDGEWSDASTARIMTSKPYQYLTVWISWPKAILKKINEPGPLDADAIKRIGMHLDASLRPR